MQARGRYWVYFWKLLTSFELPPPGDAVQVQGPGRPWLAFQRTIFRASSLPDHPQGADTHIQPGLAELEREGKNRD